MLTTPNNRKFDDMLEAMCSHLDGRTCTVDGERGRIRRQIGQKHAAFGYRTPDRLFHEPAKAARRPSLACISDLMEREDLFDIARRQGFNFSEWGY